VALLILPFIDDHGTRPGERGGVRTPRADQGDRYVVGARHAAPREIRHLAQRRGQVHLAEVDPPEFGERFGGPCGLPLCHGSVLRYAAARGELPSEHAGRCRTGKSGPPTAPLLDATRRHGASALVGRMPGSPPAKPAVKIHHRHTLPAGCG
jgi:hypothetical protein